MDMATLSNNLLDVFYMFIGLCMAITMVFTLKDKNHKTRIGTALFWGILAFIFIFAINQKLIDILWKVFI